MTLALCRTCGVNRVKDPKHTFCSPGCVPRSVRQDNCRRGRKTFAYRRRALSFREDLDRLGRTPTREDMLAIFQRVYRRAYNSGFQAGRTARLMGDVGALTRAMERGAA